MAMAQRSNGLLKILVPLGVILTIIIVTMATGGDDDNSGGQSTAEQEATRLESGLTDEELEALGVEGDTPRDTVATLVGQVRIMRDELSQTQAESERLREENARLSQRASDVQSQIDQALRQERRRQDNEAQEGSARQNSLLAELQGEIDQLRDRIPIKDNQSQSQDEDLPVGFGLQDGRGAPSNTGYNGPGADADMVWVRPVDAPPEEEGRGSRSSSDEMAFPTSFRAGGDLNQESSRVAQQPAAREEEDTLEPVYTVPENSTLMGSLGMTALLGRVPVDGTVNDPYPFKVVIGKDNLTANGIQVPELQSAVVSGTATGDWTLSCVRGNIDSMTFVFADGTIRTVPDPEDVNAGGGNSGSGGATTIGGGDSIGWISDSHGIPCVSGVRRSNAQQYLGTQSLITAAGAGVATMMDDGEGQSVTTMNSDGSITTAMSGSQAVSQILSSGVEDMSEWVNQLYGQAFAAVYVPPGKEVAIHISKQLPIDFDTEGRRVHHDRSQSVSNALP